MKEVDIQAQMCDAINGKKGKIGYGHAFKAQTEFGKGVSDISAKIVDLLHAYLEVKMGSTNKLSPLQKKFLDDHLAAGGCGGWVRVWPMKKRGGYFMFVDLGTTRTQGPLTPGQVGWFEKRAGQPWPMRDIFEYITARTP